MLSRQAKRNYPIRTHAPDLVGDFARGTHAPQREIDAEEKQPNTNPRLYAPKIAHRLKTRSYFENQ
jgi:hypothetical protein